MAVDQNQASAQKSIWLIGLNVILMVVLAVAFVGGLQWIGLTRLGRLDVSSSGVNSLTEPTEALLKGLTEKVTLTSFYFETDIEDEDQDRFRSAVNDLLELYQVSNRSQITFESINPLQDHDERSAAFKQLARCEKFVDQANGHREAINSFQDEYSERITSIIGADLEAIQTFGQLEGTPARLITDISRLFEDISKNIKSTRQQIKDALASEVPAHGAATTLIRKTYSAVIEVITSIETVAVQFSKDSAGFSAPVLEFLGSAGSRYGTLLNDLKSEVEVIGKLPKLELDDILAQLLDGTGNPILVQTERSADVVPWRKVWAPASPGEVSERFKDRRFQGEQAITSAILRLKENTKPAVIFVRHSGAPLIDPGNRFRGQPPGAYSQMRAHLEDLNFSVLEWDLATSDTPPSIQPLPSRTLYVITRPTPPRPDPLGQRPPDPVFTPSKLDALKKAMGDSPRALFIGGFAADSNRKPTINEYTEYLSQTWGIQADDDRLIVYMEPIEPGKYRFAQGPFDASFGDHPITAGVSGTRSFFPMASSVGFSSAPPEGVFHHRLAWFEESESIWCVNDIPYYWEQQANEFVIPSGKDIHGDFLIGAAAENDTAKIAFISSMTFATDPVARHLQRIRTSQGRYLAPSFPGNTALFVNILHWLNDNTEWMNLGSPIDHSTLKIKQDAPSTLVVQIFATVVWPLLAALCGIGVYFARRR